MATVGDQRVKLTFLYSIDYYSELSEVCPFEFSLDVTYYNLLLWHVCDLSVVHCEQMAELMARDSIIMQSAIGIMLSSVRLSVCLSVCHTTRWISQKRLNLDYAIFVAL